LEVLFLDTGTHLVFGLGLAGLAYVDPVVANSSTVAAAVLIGTVAGQQAPDFDTILRFKSSTAFIKHHRGISHSIPAILLWTVLITLTLELIFGGLPLLHVGFWVFTAVVLHVLSDMFNPYGTQGLRPFTKKWVSWNIIHIFDPVIFISHVIAISLWALKIIEPSLIFTTLYSFIIVYYAMRTIQYHWWMKQLPHLDQTFTKGETFMIIPTIYTKKWNVLKEKNDKSFMLGELKSGKLQWVDQQKCDDHPAIEKSRSHPAIRVFLKFSTFVCAEVKQHNWGYEVRWVDVRYRHRKNYPFVAMVLMDNEMNPIDSYVGWLSESRMIKRMGLDTAS
jgi:inner membrane protein